MTNPISAGIRKPKNIKSLLAKRHFDASRDFHSSVKSDQAGIKESSVLCREVEYSVHSDERQNEWSRKKSHLLFDIQLCQLCFVGVLVFMLATLSISLSIAVYALFLAGIYLLLIRETYRAQLVAAGWQHQHLEKPCSLSWKVFFRCVRGNPMVLFPAWRIFK